VSSVVAAAPRTLVRAVPAWAWLTGIVAVSAVVRYAFARHMVGPWIVVDELVYAELAKSFAATASFLVRDEPVGIGFGVVYPILISPAYVFEALPNAYAAAKALNAVWISLAAVPAYLLARRVVSATGALVVAALAVAVPSLFYAGTIMTENAFYPIFLGTVLLLVRALERPTAARSVLFVAGAGVAYLTRVQAVVLVAAAATAPLVLALWERRARALAAYRALYATLAAAAILALGLAALSGRTPGELLGAYRAAAIGDYDVREVARWLLYHVAELDLYVGIAPFAALLLLVSLAPRLDREARVVVAAAVTVTACLVVQVAAFASQPHVLRIEERNMFYAAPLLFTALVLWIERGAPRPALRTAAAAGVAAALPALIPYERLVNTSATSDTLAFLALWDLAEAAAVPLDELWVLVLVGAAVIAVLLTFLPARAVVVLPALVLALYLAAAQPIEARMSEASVGALFQGITHPERAWIDGAVGPTGDVAVLWTGRTDRFTVIENEFFNRSVGPVYYSGDPVPGALAQSPAGVDRADGIVRDASTAPIRTEYLLTDDSLPIAARVVARDRRRGMLLYALDGPARVSSVTDGVYADAWSGPDFTYTGFRCGRSVTARLGSDPSLFTRSTTVTAFSGGRRIGRVRVPPTGEDVLLRLPLDPEPRCAVRFVVAPTAVPADVIPGNEDTRELGVRVLAFDR
jgi:hypothetical protein